MYCGFKHLILLTSLLLTLHGFSCTIVSSVSSAGEVWTMNNEDGPHGVANFINVFPKSEKNPLGYYTLSYLSPSWGTGGNIQGGMNEAGLTFDFNSIDPISFDHSSRESFPQGDEAILPYILGNLKTVNEVIAFFEKYWFQGGFTSAQMHVADRGGHFAIISASGVKRAKKGEPLISTNFDICGNQDGSFCRRYPIADSISRAKEASLETMMEISRKTAAHNGGTLYTNIHNLSTGEIWFMSKHNEGRVMNMSIEELLAKGRRSFSFSDLNALNRNDELPAWSQPQRVELAETDLQTFSGNYSNLLIGAVLVSVVEGNIQLTFGDGSSETFYPTGKNAFSIDDKANFRIEFNEEGHLIFYEDEFWSFTASKQR